MKRSGGLVTFSILLFLAIYQEQSRGEFIADTGEVFDTVARNIDPGGLYFLICNTQTILANLEEKLSGARDSAIAVQGLSIEEKEKLRTQFAFGMRILLGSGLQNIKAFGASSKQDADGFFVNKIFVFGPSDMLWSALTNPEHDLYLNQLAPAETATFALFDLDIATLWRRLSRDLEGEQNQEITRWVRQIPKQVEGITGLSLEDLLGSVGTQFGYLLTLDPEKKVTIPVATETYQLPEPAAAFICQVRDTKIFDRVDSLLSLTTGVESVDTPDFKMRVMRGSNPVDYVSPSVAQAGSWLMISTNDKLILSVLATMHGKAPGLKSVPEFQNLTRSMPLKGNGVAYVSKRFQKTLADIESKSLENTSSHNPSLDLLSAKMVSLYSDVSSYQVIKYRNDGVFAIGRTSKSVMELLGDVVTLSSYYLSVAAIEALKQRRGPESHQ